jgi:hypothetical protein
MVKVEIWFDKSSVPIVFENARATYQKGDMFCIEVGGGVRQKYPIRNIFTVKETHDTSSQPERK